MTKITWNNRPPYNDLVTILSRVQQLVDQGKTNGIADWDAWPPPSAAWRHWVDQESAQAWIDFMTISAFPNLVSAELTTQDPAQIAASYGTELPPPY